VQLYAVPRERDADMSGEDGAAGQVQRANRPLRRLLQRRVSIGALIELAAWLAIPYLCIGFVWTVFHTEQMQRIQTRIERVMPTGADAAAFGLTTLLWPASIQIAQACPAT
jgi:hypothetical protein